MLINAFFEGCFGMVEAILAGEEDGFIEVFAFFGGEEGMRGFIGGLEDDSAIANLEAGYPFWRDGYYQEGAGILSEGVVFLFG
ncbi:MAG: hypothetical protein QXH08_06285 [Candidatus Hadarchaeales archaeon]